MCVCVRLCACMCVCLLVCVPLMMAAADGQPAVAPVGEQLQFGHCGWRPQTGDEPGTESGCGGEGKAEQAVVGAADQQGQGNSCGAFLPHSSHLHTTSLACLVPCLPALHALSLTYILSPTYCRSRWPERQQRNLRARSRAST